MRWSLVIHGFAPDPSEFPSIWEKIFFLFFFSEGRKGGIGLSVYLLLWRLLSMSYYLYGECVQPLKFRIAIWSLVGWAMKRVGGINKIRAFTRTLNSCTVKIARAPLQKKWKHAVRHTSLSCTRRKEWFVNLFYVCLLLLLLNCLFFHNFLSLVVFCITNGFTQVLVLVRKSIIKFRLFLEFSADIFFGANI